MRSVVMHWPTTMLFFLVSFAYGPLRIVSADEPETTVDALIAAIDQWQHDVRFFCTARVSTAFADSPEDALAGKFTGGPPTLEALTEHVKGSDVIRTRIDRRSKSRKVDGLWSEPADVEVARHLRSRVCLTYRHDDAQADPGGVRLEETSALPITEDSPLAGVGDDYNPVLVFGDARRPNFLRYLRQQQRDGKSVSFEVNRSHADSIVVTAVLEDAQLGTPVRFTFNFWNTKPFPMVRQVQSNTNYQGRNIFVSQTFLDFVRVDGGMLAKKVILVASTGKKSPAYAVTIWESNDLGLRGPQQQDYLVRVSPKASITCVAFNAIPKVVDGYYTFDISRLSRDDIAPECRQGPIQPVSPRPTRLWLWFVAAAALVGLATWGFYRWRRRR
ncbi:MAG: hypothetical protein KatS3mg110_3767 [Pirellulaceae bacterium]|nr:MAG: hypothetical protein KatS3mg110_3767 [Pirellulaceae bacterium]